MGGIVKRWKRAGAVIAGVALAGSVLAGAPGASASGEYELNVMVAQYSDKTQPYWEELITAV